MTIDEQLADHEARIAALEARQPSAHDTPETNPFMGRGPISDPAAPPDPDFTKVFGEVRVDGIGRALDKWEENTWNRRLNSWGGFTSAPVSDALNALLNFYEIHRGLQLKPKAILYEGSAALVFPGFDRDYGTPNCYVLPVSLIEKDFGEERKIDRTVELLDRRK